MKKLITFILFFLIVTISVSGSVATDKTAAAKIDELMKDYLELDQFAGNIIISRGDDLIYQKSFGKADKATDLRNSSDTRFNIGSMGKMFTAAAIIQLHQTGKLNLDDTIDKYIEGFPQEIAESVTIRQLLNHSSGMGNYKYHPDYQENPSRFNSIEALLPLIKDEYPKFEPGESYHYSNSGYILLGAIIEKASGMSYEEYCQKYIWEPAGMKNVSFTSPGNNTKIKSVGYIKTSIGKFKSASNKTSPALPDGGAFCAIRDIYLFFKSINGNSLISAENRELIFSPQQGSHCFGAALSPAAKTLCGKTVISADGCAPGYSVSCRFITEEGYTIIAASNYQEVSSGVCSKLEAILCGNYYTRPRKPLTELLYSLIEERGVGYVATEFKSIMSAYEASLPNDWILNSFGYELIGEGKLDEAVEIFKLNVTLFPSAPNTYDSLAEALMIKGEKDLAAKFYKRVLEMSPENVNAKEKLNELNYYK